MKKYWLPIMIMMNISICYGATQKIIYGEDGRQDIFNTLNDQKVFASKSVAGMVNNNWLKKVEGGYEGHFTRQLGTQLNLCPRERFKSQPLVATCSGFLIAEDLLVTAGHCMINVFNQSTCQMNSWVFDLRMESKDSIELSFIEEDRVYNCKKVIKAQKKGGPDFALIQLDRPVKGRYPLDMARSSDLKKGDDIYMIGHPTGLPLKVTSGGKVFDVLEDYVSTNLDAFHGNSGSPVINEKTNLVEGILVRGKPDWTMTTDDQGRECVTVNKCNENRNDCLKDSMDIEGEHFTKITEILKLI